MDASDETTTKSVTALEPSDSQFPKNHRRSKNWKKSLVYDCESETVEVKSEKNTGQ